MSHPGSMNLSYMLLGHPVIDPLRMQISAELLYKVYRVIDKDACCGIRIVQSSGVQDNPFHAVVLVPLRERRLGDFAVDDICIRFVRSRNMNIMTRLDGLTPVSKKLLFPVEPYIVVCQHLNAPSPILILGFSYLRQPYNVPCRTASQLVSMTTA